MFKKRNEQTEKKIVIKEIRTSNWAKALTACAVCVLCYKTTKLFVAPNSCSDSDIAKKIKANIDILNNKKDGSTNDTEG